MTRAKCRIVAIAVVTLLVVVLAPTGYYVYRRSVAQRELAAILAELDRDDPGWRLADLERTRSAVPPEQDSAPLILKLKRQVPNGWWKDAEGEGPQWSESPPGEPLSAQHAAFLQARIGEIDRLLPEIRRLADQPRGFHRIAWAPDSISTLVRHLEDVREMAALLLRDVYWQAHQGEQGTALVSCRAILCVARSLDEESILISQLTRTACLRLSLNGAQHTLASGETAAANLLPLQKAFAEADRCDAIVVGLRGERAGMHVLFSNLTDGTVPGSLVKRLSGMPRGAGMPIADKAEELYLMASVQSSHVWILRHFNSAIDAVRLPAAEQKARIDTLHAEPAMAPPLAKLLTCAWSRCNDAFRRDRARVRCAIVGLAAERHRLEHGQWPADLAALVPEYLAAAPLDPYTDEPLKYKKAGNGIVVFSASPDGNYRGDYYDQPEPPAVVPPALPGQYYEFRLWDPIHRGKPLAERVAR